MAGHMSEGEAQDKEKFPYHHAIAEVLNGEVKPFDQYQGPYVKTGYGKFWIIWEDMRFKIYNERTGEESTYFPPRIKIEDFKGYFRSFVNSLTKEAV